MKKRNMKSFLAITAVMSCLFVGTASAALAGSETSDLLTNFGNYNISKDISYGGTTATASSKFEFGSTFRADYMTTTCVATNSQKVYVYSWWRAKSGWEKSDSKTDPKSVSLLLKGKVGYGTNEIKQTVTVTCANGQNRTHKWHGLR